MSKNLTPQKRENRIATTIIDAQKSLSSRRSLQLQGNSSLGLGVLEGYFTMSIPTTLDPSVATVDVTAPEGINVIIGNLMYSTFYGIAAGGATPTGVSFQSGDKVGIWPEYVTWECFLAYDKRSKGAGTLPNQADVLGTIVDDDVARITAKMKAYANWDIPIGATTTILVVYQIRATLA